jgi:GDP-L-fucose synthase
MRILITGGTGMVGKNLLEHPGAARHEVLAPDRATLNLLDADAVQAYLLDARPDMVIHAAGRVGGIQANMREPVRFLVENIAMGRNVVLGARAAAVPRLINLGSSCMYPRDRDTPLTEDLIGTGALEPTNEGYALAKISVARLCGYVKRETPACDYKTVIPCNLYGRHDKFDPAWSRPFSTSSIAPGLPGSCRSRYGATARPAASSCMRATSPMPCFLRWNTSKPCRT